MTMLGECESCDLTWTYQLWNALCSMVSNSLMNIIVTHTHTLFPNILCVWVHFEIEVMKPL